MNAGSSSKLVAAVVGFGLGVVIELPALMLAFISSGAGHGDYAAARALFPAPMLLTLMQGDTIGALSITIGLLQFPTYGALLGWSTWRRNHLPAVLLVLAHLIAASICFAGTLPNFS